MGEKWTNTHGTTETVPERSVTRERVALVYPGRLSTEAYDARCALIAAAPAMAEALEQAAMELVEAANIIAGTLPNTGSIFRAAAERHRAVLALARGEPSPNAARTALNADQASGRDT